jgi:hypothetical protein
MTTSEWQSYVSTLSNDEWYAILLGVAGYELWVSVGRPDYPHFHELRDKAKQKRVSDNNGQNVAPPSPFGEGKEKQRNGSQ